MNDSQNKTQELQEDSSNELEESSSLIKTEEVSSKIEEFIDAIPEEKREEARHIFRELRETFVGIIERSPTSKLSPEIAKILTASADKDNEFRFKYLTQKQTDETDLEKEEIKFRQQKHQDGFSLVKPVVYFVLVLVAICILTGIWLCVNGQPTLGASLITGSLSSVLSFAAGFGASTFYKDEKKK